MAPKDTPDYSEAVIKATLLFLVDFYTKFANLPSY